MKGAIFDMDGVLVDNNAFHKKAWLKFLEHHGKKLTDLELNQHVYGKINGDILRYVFGPDLDPETVARLSRKKEEIYREVYAPEIAPPPGLIDLLKTLHQRVPMAVATSAPPENLDFVLDALNIREFFGCLVHEAMVQNGKPNPEIYLLAAQKMGLEPDDCVVFEDSLAGVESGQRAGMKVVAITSTYPASALDHADLVIESFDQVDPQFL